MSDGAGRAAHARARPAVAAPGRRTRPPRGVPAEGPALGRAVVDGLVAWTAHAALRVAATGLRPGFRARVARLEQVDADGTGHDFLAPRE